VKKMRVTVNGVSYDVEVEMLEDDEQPGLSYGYGASGLHSAPAPTPVPVGAGAGHAASPAPAAPPRPFHPNGGGVLESPIAGIVVEVKVELGARVELNQPVLVIEAMKMNTNVSSPTTGRVSQVLVKAGDHVVQGQPLVKFE